MGWVEGRGWDGGTDKKLMVPLKAPLASKLPLKAPFALLCAAVDEQNAQTQQQLFSLSRDEEEEGLAEEEYEELEEDKVSLQSSYSIKNRSTRRGQC